MLMLTNAQRYSPAISLHSRLTSSYVPSTATTVGWEIRFPRTFADSRSDGIKTKHLNPACAAWAETELARFPVEAHATVSKPNSLARVSATATTRSLKDSVGWFTVSFLRYKASRPRVWPRRVARIIGVKPPWRPTVASFSTGSRSIYRHRLFGPATIRSREITAAMAS